MLQLVSPSDTHSCAPELRAPKKVVSRMWLNLCLLKVSNKFTEVVNTSKLSFAEKVFSSET